MFTRAKIYTYVKWAISVLAYGFLAYKLATFDGYDAFVEQVSSFGAEQFVWLALAVVLLPLNLFLESEKWRLLVGNLVTLDVKTALRSVLIGHTGAFSTPNRLGEYPMRAMSLPSDVRLSAIAMGFVGSFVQNFIITVCGLLALLFFQIGELFSTFFTISADCLRCFLSWCLSVCQNFRRISYGDIQMCVSSIFGRAWQHFRNGAF